jgi:hypothetical protein
VLEGKLLRERRIVRCVCSVTLATVTTRSSPWAKYANSVNRLTVVSSIMKCVIYAREVGPFSVVFIL